jgi:hypothetical protein
LAGRWLAAVVLLCLVVALLVRVGPAEHPQPRWASAGSLAAWVFVTASESLADVQLDETSAS